MTAEYMIAAGHSAESITAAKLALEAEVAPLLQDRWMPTGGVAAIVHIEGSVTLLQSLVKIPAFVMAFPEPMISFTSTVPFLGTLSGD